MVLATFIVTSTTFAPNEQHGIRRNRCSRRTSRKRFAVAELRGYCSKFSGDGKFLSEEPVSIVIPSDEIALIESATPLAPSSSVDNSSVAFHSGAVSRGPLMLNESNSLALDAILPANNVRVLIRTVYNDGKRTEFSVTAVSENGEQPFGTTAPLESRDIYGSWLGDNYRWSAISAPTIMRYLPRSYRSVNSTSPSLVRLPLGISVVASPNIFSGSKFSFGTGWLPAQNLRPVMIRSYDEGGRLEKVDWRNEIRQ